MNMTIADHFMNGVNCLYNAPFECIQQGMADLSTLIVNYATNKPGNAGALAACIVWSLVELNQCRNNYFKADTILSKRKASALAVGFIGIIFFSGLYLYKNACQTQLEVYNQCLDLTKSQCLEQFEEYGVNDEMREKFAQSEFGKTKWGQELLKQLSPDACNELATLTCRVHGIGVI